MTNKSYFTNDQLRLLKAKYGLSTKQILSLLTSVNGGPSKSAINSWLTKKGSEMPANSLDLLKVRLHEAGY